jgi:hypothetical protein
MRAVSTDCANADDAASAAPAATDKAKQFLMAFPPFFCAGHYVAGTPLCCAARRRIDCFQEMFNPNQP